MPSYRSPTGGGQQIIAIPKGKNFSYYGMPGAVKLPSEAFSLTDPGKGLAGKPKYASRGVLTSGTGQVFRGMGTDFTVDLHLVGHRVLIGDMVWGAQLFLQLLPQVVGGAGELVTLSAYQDAPFSDDTGQTRKTLMEGSPAVYWSGGDIIADMGPSTYYAPFLEFGWTKGGVYRSYPFMIPALDKHTIDFINGNIDIVGIIAGERPYIIRGEIGKNPYLQTLISGARKRLYSYEKALGDVQVFTGSGIIGPTRDIMLTMAKELGDLQAIMNHAVAARVSTRIRGSVTGRGLGYTRTVSVSKSYTAYPGGGNSSSVGSRVYNRVAGRATRPIATGRFP